MGKPTGFLEFPRYERTARPVHARTRDDGEVYAPVDEAGARQEGARCMDCGIPFCHSGCPLGNRIPEWNDAVYRGEWSLALRRLQATNNFPELTGHLCPAPCEAACVLALHGFAVNIKAVELGIVEHAFAQGWMQPRIPPWRTGRRVAVVGSGPAGLAAADELNQMGHSVTVFERDDKPGGLLRYGIPDFKMAKRVLDRRLDLLAREGIAFRVNTNVGEALHAQELLDTFDAVLLACGALAPRPLTVPGHELQGVHYAMPYLTQQNRRCHTPAPDFDQPIHAAGKHVVIIGGGDTAADCLGTAHRQGALSVHQLDIHAEPPAVRAAHDRWPAWPRILRNSPAHMEGGMRVFAAMADRFDGAQGHVRAVQATRVRLEGTPRRVHREPDSAFTLAADLVLVAVGFAGTERTPLLSQLNIKLTAAQTAWRDAEFMTNQPGIFTAGDMQRGASLVVTAIADGRHAAHAMGRYIASTRYEEAARQQLFSCSRDNTCAKK